MIAAAALLDHPRRRRAAGLERRAEMRVDQLVELCLVIVEDRLAGRPAVPAQFTRMSMRPNSLDAPVDQRVGDRRVRRRARMGDRTVDILSAASVAASASRPLTTTPAPSSARSAATAEPDTARSADHDGAAAGQRCANRPASTGFIMSMFQ